MGEKRYGFDGFVLDVDARQLHGADGEPVALSAKAFDTLSCLIRDRDRIVSKEELIARVWPGRVVEDNNLAQAVSSLRRVEVLMMVTSRLNLRQLVQWLCTTAAPACFVMCC